jgi:SAM-dependent methyltransferase
MENRGFRPEASYLELKDIYNLAYQRGEIAAAQAYYRRCLELLEPRPGGRLLDIACGAGYLLQEAEAAGLESYGVDISDEAVGQAGERAPGSRVQVANAEELPWENGFFDYVTVLGSLEHFVAPERALFEIHRVLRGGGRANFVLPNAGYLWDRIKRVLGRGHLSESTQPIGRVATASEWSALLGAAGFQVQDVTPIPDLPQGLGLRSLALTLTNPLIPSTYAYQWAFLCGKPGA